MQNRTRLLKIAIYGSVLASLAVGYGQACSDSQLTRARPGLNVSSESAFCLSDPETRIIYTKFLFVVDKSGSNVNNNDQGAPTDPKNIHRAQNIENFYNQTMSDPETAKYVKWGMIAFQGSGAFPLIKSSPTQPVFTQDTGLIAQGFQALRGTDRDATPYRSALAMTRAAIKYDLDQTSKTEPNSKYMIVFMSDGRPTDYPGDSVASEAAFADVRDIIKLSPGNIRLSTAYYGHSDPPAAQGLETMAEVGLGKFVDINATGKFEISDLIVGGESKEPYEMRNLIVYNVNSAICFDRKYGMDSDADGLCDVDEDALRVQGKGPYDSTKRYSFTDNYNDYMHYMSQKTGAILTSCTAPDAKTDADFDLLNKCEETFVQNASAMSTLGRIDGDPLNPDTDRDGIVDGLEYLALQDKSSPIDPLNILRNLDSDPDSAYSQIAKHRNPKVPDQYLKAEDTYDTKWDYVGFNDEGQRCFSFYQKFLKTYPTRAVSASNTLPYLAHGAGENVVLVYYIQSPENDPISDAYFMYRFQKLTSKSGVEGLKIGPGYMTPYRIPLPANFGL